MALTLLVAACASSKKDVPAQLQQVRDTSTVKLKTDCTPTTCAGTRNGAAYSIQLPSGSWNGTLLIWSHGYRPAAPVPANPLAPATTTPATLDRTAQTAPTPAIARTLLSQGYALAGSAFARNGWDVPEAVSANEDLYSYFKDTFGTPNRVYLWGDSLGALITQTLAEKHPEWVSGVAPMCGVLAGTNLNLDLALDVAYAVKQLVYPRLQLTGYTSVAQAVAQWSAASRALVAMASRATTPGIANLFAIAAIADAPTRTDMFDGATLRSQIPALVQGAVVALGYSTYGRYDVEQRVGGNPSQNTGVNYAARIGDQYSALIGDQRTRILTALDTGRRVAADPAARAKADGLGNPTGAVERPTITLHTEYDPVAIVQNESVFQSRVVAHGTAGQLVQLYTGPPTTYQRAPYGAGHCNFTPTEYVGVVDLLDQWVRQGVYAGPGAVAGALNYTVDPTQSSKNNPRTIAAGTATTGYNLNFAAPPWPGRP